LKQLSKFDGSTEKMRRWNLKILGTESPFWTNEYDKGLQGQVMSCN